MKFFRILFITTILVTSFSKAQAEDNFFIRRGERFELCKELKEVLNDPANEDFIEPYIQSSEFNIPKKYKNFSLPKWQDIAMEDLPRYLKDPNIVFNAMQKNGHDINKYHLQKTEIDFNSDGKKEVMLRLKTDNKNDMVYHYFSDIEEVQDDFFQRFNEIQYFNKLLFFYKGKVFTNSSSGAAVDIAEPKISKLERKTYVEGVCDIYLVPSKEKIALKKFDYDSDMRHLKKLEEIQKINSTKERAGLILKLQERLKSYKEE